MPEKDILFIPDCNLGSWVKKQVPEKNIKLVSGGCPTHVRVTVKDVEKAKAVMHQHIYDQEQIVIQNIKQKQDTV